MTEWRDISTAPKDRVLLLYGHIDPSTSFEALRWNEPSVFTGAWDSIDEAWVPLGGTWEGPFMVVSHWAERPDGPDSTP